MSRRAEQTQGDGNPTTKVLRRYLTAVTACAVLLLFSVAGGFASSHADGKVSTDLVRKLQGSKPDDLVAVIVQTVDDPTDLLLAKVHGRGGVIKTRHSSIKGYSASLPASVIEDLADDPEVEHVSLDAPVHSSMDIAMKAIRADVAIKDNLGLDGSGVGIALIDTGVQLHPDLARSKGSPQPIEIEIVGRERGMQDYYGHGTHVAGILNGSGAMSSGPEAFRTFRGLAPGAQLISVRALQPDGSGLTSDVITAIDWVVLHRRANSIRVLNLSLGHPVAESYLTDPLCRAVERAVAAGIVVVVSAGNEGRVGTGFGTITSPGNDPKVITVGAMDDNRTAAREDDVLAPYSSKGPTLVDYVVKPDLVAPGSFLVSLRARGSWIDTAHHELVLRAGDYLSTANPDRDGDYLTLSGTSLAAPMVAGAAALMIQKDPTLRVSDVKARLMATATKDGLLPFEDGAGYLDVAAALASVLTASSSSSPRAVPQGDGTLFFQPVDGVWNDAWQQSLIWGGGRGLGLISLSENDQVTASGLIWGGGTRLLDTLSVDTDAIIWGGGH
ncbi:MAG TPA: S8 family serine peptidase [Patescibacteria group bacterium]|nr:S8 family serine peptidase [Patescibacteria group bacterium]